MSKLRNVALATIIMGTIATSGCSDNRSYTRDFIGIPESETFNYAVVGNGANSTVHKVKNWSGGKEKSVRIQTECCENTLRGQTITLYSNKPTEQEYTSECFGK